MKVLFLFQMSNGQICRYDIHLELTKDEKDRSKWVTLVVF